MCVRWLDASPRPRRRRVARALRAADERDGGNGAGAARGGTGSPEGKARCGPSRHRIQSRWRPSPNAHIFALPRRTGMGCSPIVNVDRLEPVFERAGAPPVPGPVSDKGQEGEHEVG